MTNTNRQPPRPTDRDEEPPGIPHHRLLRRIGRGSYGDVWLALNAMDKWCAVKVVYRDALDGHAYDQEFRGLRRYDDLAGIDASLMPVKNVGEDPDRGFFYYAMELADDANTRAPLPRPDGDEFARRESLRRAVEYRPWTLTEELRHRSRLAYAECIEHGLALSAALEQLHQGQLVHRDVKPSNIIFVHGRPKLADVGLVIAADATRVSLAGTSGFVPLHGAGTMSGDVFALGKVIYLMATGRPVEDFPAETRELGELDDVDRHHQAELRAVYDRACDLVPEDRHQSARELREELELLRRNDSVLRLRQLEEERAQLVEQTRKQRRRIRLLAAFAALVILGAALTAYVSAERDRATRRVVLAQLETSQYARMQQRVEGWSRRDWDQVRSAAKGRVDDAVLGQAVSTLSGLDALQIGYWRDIETSSAAFGPDGRVLLAGGGRGRASLLTGLTNRLESPVSGEGKVAWTTAGQPLVLLVETNACVVRDARTGSILRAWSLPEGEAVKRLTGPALAIGGQGRFAAASLISARGAGRIVVWDIETGAEVGEAPRAATALEFSPDGAWLAAGEASGVIRIFRTVGLELDAVLPPPLIPNPITALAFGANRHVRRGGLAHGSAWLLAAGDLGTGIVVWDLHTRLPRSFCRGSTWNVQALAFHPGGLTLASAGRNGVLLWDAMTGAQLLKANKSCGGDTRALAFDPTGKYLVAGSNADSQFAEISLWEIEPHRGIQRLRGLGAVVRKVWLSPDARRIAALSDDWLVGIWDVESGRLEWRLEVPPGSLAESAGGIFNGAGDRFAFANRDGAQLYDVTSGRTVDAWTLPVGAGEELQYDAQGRLLLVRMERDPGAHGPRIWQLRHLAPGGKVIALQRQSDTQDVITSLAFPAGGSCFLAMCVDADTGRNRVLAIDTDSGRERWRRETERTNAWFRVVADPTGTWCLFSCGPGDERTSLVGVVDGQVREVFSHRSFVLGSSASLRADLPTTSQVLILENPAAHERIPISFDGLWFSDTFTFSRDERFFATGNTDGTVLVAGIDEVRQRLRTLSGEARAAGR
ncbi:MAG: protein kinase family protein [Limisphaerales bacterium]